VIDQKGMQIMQAIIENTIEVPTINSTSNEVPSESTSPMS